MDVITQDSMLQKIFDYVESSKEWVVLVCPSLETALEYAKYVSSYIPPYVKFSGRTADLMGGKLSVCSVTESVFLEDQPFTVAFVGWDSDNREQAMLKWQKASAKTLRL